MGGMTPAALPQLGPQLGSVLPWLDLLGIAVFAASGALAATARAQTFVTAAFFALVTGVGGGTIRDLLIGAPVWWVHHPFISGLCLGVAALIWVTPQRWWNGRALDWLDALGLAAYAVFGAAKALSFGIPPGRAIDPDAPRALRDRRSPCRAAPCRPDAAGAARPSSRAHCRIRRLRAARRCDRLEDQAAGLPQPALN
jgi:hypothetical protein